MSPAEAAFLAAIRLAPDDALTRLVYADWLEDEGGDARRGAYLRAWCAMLDKGVRDLDGYSEGAERLEALALGAESDWLDSVDSTRFHLTDVEQIMARAEAFFLRYGGAAGLIDARVTRVSSSGGNWGVVYERGGATIGSLIVVRATGRVYMMKGGGYQVQTHRPDTTAPS